MEEKVWRLVKEIAQGRQLGEAVRRAGMNTGEAELAISFLIAEGYMVELGRDYECVCSRCPLRGICVAPVSFRGRTYALVKRPRR